MKSLFYLVSMLLLATSVQAVEVTQLYQTEVTVNDRSRGERQRNYPKALTQTLVKLTGDAQIGSDPRVKKMLASATGYVSKFEYLSSPLRLQVNFDPSQLLKTMRQQRLPIWGNQRPLTLVWLATEDESGDRQMFSEQLPPATLAQWQQSADDKGLPLSLPLMDLEDAMRVSVNDVWGFFVDPIADASQRYRADFFALAKLSPTEEGWEYWVTLYPYEAPASEDRYGFGNVRRSVMQSSGVLADDVAAKHALQADIADYFARRYASVASEEKGQKQLTFVLSGQMEELIEIERYLNQQSSISSATLVSLKDNQVSFEIEVVGSLQALRQILELDPKVEALPTDDQLVERSLYRWIGQP